MSWVIKQLYHPFWGDSQNYEPLGVVDHLMIYRPRPWAKPSIVHQVVHSTGGMIVLTVTQKCICETDFSRQLLPQDKQEVSTTDG